MDTSVKQTLGSVPLVSVLNRFDWTCIAGGIYHMQLPFSTGPFVIVWALKPQEKWKKKMQTPCGFLLAKFIL